MRKLKIKQITFLYFSVNAAFHDRYSKPVHSHEVSCPNSLCKWKPVGTLFGLSASKPKYFVTCTNAGSVCRKCQDGMIFDTRNTVCVPQFRGSKHNVHKHVSHKHVSHRHVSHVSHHVRQHVTAPTAVPHKKADIECKI